MANKEFDVIIIGGSYAGLSAAMTLGRAMRKVLVIDSGKPCNMPAPHAHNFITQDGQSPAAIHALAVQQISAYPTVTLLSGLAVQVAAQGKGYEVSTEDGSTYSCSKLIFATGVRNIMPSIEGFSDCWGISVVHCPYCHGYEYRGRPTAILADGITAFEFCKMISNWSNDLTLFTNGPSGLDDEQLTKLGQHKITIIEKQLAALQHEQGNVNHVLCADGSRYPVSLIYSRPPFEQHCLLPMALGCELNENGFIKTDDFKRTTVPGVFAAGDNTTHFRTLSYAVGAGTLAAAVLNNELITERF